MPLLLTLSGRAAGVQNDVHMEGISLDGRGPHGSSGSGGIPHGEHCPAVELPRRDSPRRSVFGQRSHHRLRGVVQPIHGNGGRSRPTSEDAGMDAARPPRATSEAAGENGSTQRLSVRQIRDGGSHEVGAMRACSLLRKKSRGSSSELA